MATKKKVKAVKAAKKKSPAKKSAKKIVAKKVVAKKKAAAPKKVAAAKRTNGAARSNGNGLPPPSSAAWGKAGKALDGVRILDFTHVQSGPTCTQLLAYMGADCIKVERPGQGDITRGQLRDVKGADLLYFTMLNGNKRSITIDSKHPKGKEILERLVKVCDVLVENFAPGAIERMGLSWENVHKLNPRIIMASVKGFGPGPYEECKVYENVAQCAGGAASTTGFREGPPLVTGAQIGDFGHGPASRLRHRHGALSAQSYGTRPARAVRDAGRRAQPRARETARSAAPEAWTAHGIQPVRRRDSVRQSRAARGQRFRRRSAGLDLEVQRLRRRIPMPISISSRRRRCGSRSAI